MDESHSLERTIIRRAAIVLAVAVPVLAAVGLHRVALGSLAGAAFGIGSFHLLGSAISAAIAAGPGRAPMQAGLKYLARYTLTALALYGALRFDLGVFVGMVTGIVVVKLVILLTGIFGPL
ncbi:MAG: ATP synthase subunit I [Bacillota bacterium]